MITNWLKNTLAQQRHRRGRTKYGTAPKVFCIGRNKTGTTSLKFALTELGFAVGNQRMAEKLFDQDYFVGKFDRIIEYCHSYEAFQDVPFSCPETYKYLDVAFPGSKFILTVRDSPAQWYDSLVRFHAKVFGQGNTPTYAQLSQARYMRQGYATNIVKLHGTEQDDPYNRQTLIDHYNRHNSDVAAYFADRPNDLLTINLSGPNDYQRMTEFLGRPSKKAAFPWKNKNS